jgi:hypothetical protein
VSTSAGTRTAIGTACGLPDRSVQLPIGDSDNYPAIVAERGLGQLAASDQLGVGLRERRGRHVITHTPGAPMLHQLKVAACPIARLYRMPAFGSGSP